MAEEQDKGQKTEKLPAENTRSKKGRQLCQKYGC